MKLAPVVPLLLLLGVASHLPRLRHRKSAPPLLLLLPHHPRHHCSTQAPLPPQTMPVWTSTWRRTWTVKRPKKRTRGRQLRRCGKRTTPARALKLKLEGRPPPPLQYAAVAAAPPPLTDAAAALGWKRRRGRGCCWAAALRLSLRTRRAPGGYSGPRDDGTGTRHASTLPLLQLQSPRRLHPSA